MVRILGLTPAEQDLYEALVARPPVTGAELAALGADRGWDRRDGPLPDRLLELGLVIPFPGDPTRYAAAPPQTALEGVLGERGRDLAAARRHVLALSARYRHRTSSGGDDPLIEVVRGRPAIEQCLVELNRAISHEIWGFDAPPYFDPPGTGNVASSGDGRTHISYRVVYTREALTGRASLAGVIADRPTTEEVRAGDVPVKLFLYDRRTALMPLDHVTVPIEAFVVIRDPGLVAVLCDLFEVYWARATPVNVRNGQVHTEGTPGPPPGVDRELLSLLVAGFADRAVADRLGWADRTVRRRVRDMMTHLGATTRFQAGYQAVARGWLAAAPDGDVDAGL